jgi:hypothetical protein
MEIVIAIVFFVVLILITMYIGLQKKDIIEEDKIPVIHTSGIYSVIRQSPREHIYTVKPDMDKIKTFVSGAQEDVNGVPLSETDKEKIIVSWENQLEKNLKIIEEGDKIGVQRFLIKPPADDLPCRHFIEKNCFITREDIYKHPELIPPYYPGCQCILESESEWRNATDMEHFRIDQEDKSHFPAWENIRKVT